jgi:hypothetical protein
MGYVHKDHLSTLWDTPQEYSAGDDILARVLYVLPTVKFVYLSLKKEPCDPEAISAPSKSLKFGDIVKKAKVSLYLGGISFHFILECRNVYHPYMLQVTFGGHSAYHYPTDMDNTVHNVGTATSGMGSCYQCQ